MSTSRSTRAEDLPGVARCHAKAFPHALSTLHGTRFTERILEWYVVADRGVLIHLEEDGKVIGYCGGIKTHVAGEPGAFTSITQFAFWDFVAAFARRPWLLFHPDNMNKRATIVRNLWLRLRPANTVMTPASSDDGVFKRRWGLVVIGVDPEYHGKGHGSTLLREFERLACADQAEFVSLSVKRINRSAIESYQRNGWVVVSRSAGTQLMRKDLLPRFPAT